MSITELIAQLQSMAAVVPPQTTVYVREDTARNGASWVSPRSVKPGYDPYPISAPDDGSLVVFIS